MSQNKSQSVNQLKLNKTITDQIDEWFLKFPKEHKKSAIIASLSIVQKYNNGWLSQDLMMAVANYLNLPAICVYEVASFYNKFELKPPSKHKISICTNISCMLSGCKSIVKHLSNKLDIGLNQTTKDGKYTLKEVDCVSCCDKAPFVEINGQKIYNATIEVLDGVLNNLK